MPRAPTYISLVANLCISDIYPISVLSRHRPAMTFRRDLVKSRSEAFSHFRSCSLHT